MTFGEKLKSITETEKLSVSGLFKKTGLQRSLIYAIMRGERRLTPENCGRLINPICFPDEIVPGLFLSYLESELGPEELDAWNVFLSGLRGETAEEIKKHRAFDFPAFDIKTNQVYYGQDEVFAAIGSVIYKGTDSLMSDFAFDGELPALIFNAYISDKIKNVRHVVRFDGLAPAKKLKSLFAAVAFAEAGIDTGILNLGGAAYDSFILTDDYFIEYMDDLSQAVIYPANVAPRTLADRIGSAETITFRFSDVAESVMKNEYVSGSGGKNSWFGFPTQFPLVFATKENVLESLNPALLDSVDALTMANGLEKHFSVTTAGTSDWHSLMTDSAVDDFFEHGTLTEAPKILFPNGASVNTRICMAEPFLNTPGYKLTIILSKYFGELRQYLTANDTGIQLFGVSEGVMATPYAFTDIRVILNDQKLSKLCKKLTDYFSNSYYCMSDSIGKSFLAQRISVMKGMSRVSN